METSRRDLARVLSPLALWLTHVAYLAAWSPDPFLTRWLEGSFSFFLALVLCNVIRSRVLAPQDPAGEDDAPDEGATGGPDGGGDGAGADTARK